MRKYADLRHGKLREFDNQAPRCLLNIWIKQTCILFFRNGFGVLLCNIKLTLWKTLFAL
jgi:hypothetical protein